MARILTILTAIALYAVVLLLGESESKSGRFGPKREAEKGPYPAEWFMQQRLWPDVTIPTADFLAAAEQAERLSQRTLDDPPVWIEAGPGNIGGRVTDIVGHPANPQLFYIGSASGGIFKTVNNGASWTPIFDDQPTQSIGALAIDVARPDTIYVGTGEPNSAGFSYFGTGLYRTPDAGATWEHLGLAETRYISRVVIDPQDPASLWVAALGELYAESEVRGVYHSTDMGVSWSRVLYVNDSTGASDLVIHPENSQILYAATWQRLRSPERRVVGGVGSGIYRTSDGGQSWQRLQDGLPQPAANIGRIGLAISPSDPDILYAIYADDPGYFFGIFKTTDGGETWGRVNDGGLGSMYANFGWYFGNIRVRPDNPNMVFALGQILMRSTDGGQNWFEIGTDVHVDHHALWFYPAQPTRMLVGCDGGAYVSTNNGNGWSFLTGLHNNQFYAATVDPQHPARRYGGTQDQGTLRTLTGAVGDWENIHGGDGFHVIVDPTNSDRIYAEYQWGWLDRSEDGGASWVDATNGIDGSARTNWSTPIALSPHNSQTLYYGNERLYRTTNRADSWSAISPDLTDGGGPGNLPFGTITTIDPSALDPNLIYAGTDDANFWVTTNGGTNWLNRSSGLPNRWITKVAADPHDRNGCYVTITGYRNAETDAHIFRSEDQGQHWTNISGELPAGPLNDVIVDPEIIGRLYVGSDFGAYVTPDYGEHWYPLGEGLPRVPVIDLVLHAPTHALTAATYGRSMYRADLTTLSLNRVPVISSALPPPDLDSVDAGTALHFAIEAIDPDGQQLEYAWYRNGDPVSGTDTTTILFATPGATDQIAVEVSDGELSARHFWTLHTLGTALREPRIVPQSPLLLQAYPNPFNSSATIRFALPIGGHAVLSLYDLTGRRVRPLLDAAQPAGEQRIMLTAGDLPSGTYFVSLHTPAGDRHAKLLLLK
ncbi:T9SS type A sorting domain-containing protein [candidate division KSB1 bacterium]|nr:T9SS type A sorting domain-containing protein [candidate division KSB1 bacterium]